MKHINIYNTTEEYNAAKSELYTLEHFVAYNKETNEILTKDIVNITFNITPEDATINYSIDNESYDQVASNGVPIQVTYKSTLYYKISKDGYVAYTSTCYVNKNVTISYTMSKKEAEVGDIIVYKDGKFLVIDSNELTNEGTPIGVVVIPSSHNVYGDGSYGVMSLKPMNCSTPATGGTSEQSMYWGVGTDITSLPNLDQVSIVGSGSNVGNASSTVTGQDDYAYLPSDKFSAVQCPHDTDAYYYSSSSSDSQAPSPYLTDGSRNPAYYQTTSPSSSNNCLADFDGRGNTNKIITQRGSKDYSSWKPSTNSESDYPAASCCDMFYTEGTQQGDWYLPAMGELGYIMPPFNKINEAITKMCSAYGSSVGFTLSSPFHWSSSEYNHYFARYLATNIGYVRGNAKSYKCYVQAFLRINSNGVVRN